MKPEALKKRKTEHEVDNLFPARWSPRAMSGEPIPKEELMSLFEAARWAPSSYNNQPWRFVYALRDTEHWDRLFKLMGEFNMSWTVNAAALVVIISKKTFDYSGKPSRTHSFDTGAAWENLALQGSMKGLVVHGMEGFDYEAAKDELGIPDDYQVEAMVAIGRPGSTDDLPRDLRERETPSGRKKIVEIAFEGRFR
jgi:nitroreductase